MSTDKYNRVSRHVTLGKIHRNRLANWQSGLLMEGVKFGHAYLKMIEMNVYTRECLRC